LINSSANAYTGPTNLYFGFGATESTTQGSGSGYFDGRLDQIKFWDSALTAAQVAAEYKETNAYFMNMDSASDWVTSMPGMGRALDFDGSDDFLDVGDPAVGMLDFGTNDFSLQAWVKTGQSGYQVIASKTNTTTNNGFSLRMDTSSNYPEFILDDNVSYKVIAKRAINDSAWHHVAATREGDYLKIYVDGALSNQIAGVDSVDVSGTEHFNVGRVETVASGYWNGNTDEVKSYNYARSAAEIKTDFNQGATKFN
jgi:hypothetical protein